MQPQSFVRIFGKVGMGFVRGIVGSALVARTKIVDRRDKPHLPQIETESCECLSIGQDCGQVE